MTNMTDAPSSFTDYDPQSDDTGSSGELGDSHAAHQAAHDGTRIFQVVKSTARVNS